MNKILYVGLVFGVLFQFNSCTTNNEEEYFEGVICDTTAVVYPDLTHIFIDICLQCHSSGFTYRDGIEFDNYEKTKSSMLTGKVIPAIKHEGPNDMPFKLPKLSDCDIAKVEAWLNAGIPESENK